MKDDHLMVPLLDSRTIGRYLIFRLDISGVDYSFRAGKYATLSIPSDGEGNFGLTRIFSIASSPNSHGYVRFATIKRENSAFKERISEMRPGEMVDISPPSGGFFLISDRERPVVFITSGIGITPVVSILSWCYEEGIYQKMRLIYLNETEENELFMGEILEAAEGMKDLTVNRLRSGTRNESISSTLSERRMREITGLNDYRKAMFYISGIPRFVYDTAKALRYIGIGNASMKTEKFSGY